MKGKRTPSNIRFYKNKGGRWWKKWLNREETSPNLPNNGDITGSRIFIKGASVNHIKRIVGKFAKKVRTADGKVEVIHTDNKHQRVYRLLEDRHKVDGFTFA